MTVATTKLILKPVEFKGFSIRSGDKTIGHVQFSRFRDHKGVYCSGGIKLEDGRFINCGDTSDKWRYCYFADLKRDLAHILTEEGVQL